MKNSIREAYARLYRRFGPQGWWPTTPPGSSMPVYAPRRSLKKISEQERFEVCLGALLTQNTSWGNVVKVLSLLASRKKLSHAELLRMPLGRMERLFRSSGYFRQKARRVKNFLKQVQKETGGHYASFLAGPMKKRRKELLAIDGIGPETADSMLLYAAGHPIFVVDAYTKRAGMRWGVLNGHERYEEIQAAFSEALPLSAEDYAEYHALIVKLGKDFCTKRNPRCGACALKKLCRHGSLPA